MTTVLQCFSITVFKLTAIKHQFRSYIICIPPNAGHLTKLTSTGSGSWEFPVFHRNRFGIALATNTAAGATVKYYMSYSFDKFNTISTIL